MSFVGYESTVYPLDKMRGHLEGIAASSDPDAILVHLNAINLEMDKIWDKLPENKNPVWIFKTETTNFLRIKADITSMMSSIETISAVPEDSSAYHTGMIDLKTRAINIRENVMDATPYMYVSISNILYSTIWIAVIIGIFAALKRKKDQLTTFDEASGV